MKRLLMVTAFILANALLAESDFSRFFSEANNAMKSNDYATAEQKFDEAIKAAQDSKLKTQAILGKFKSMRRQKKIREAEKFALTSVEDEKLKPSEVRQILNTVADSLLWSPRIDFALDLLKQAQNFECPKRSNVFYKTFYDMAILYDRKNQPQSVIEVLDNILKVREQHPANLYTAYLKTGMAYEKLGKKDEALKSYNAALECGRRVKYKFDFSPAEKAIERLSR